MTLVELDSQDPQHVIVAGAPISEITDLTSETFIPRGGTPLLDATGLLSGRVRVEAAAREATGLPKEDILFISITDGEENQSREHTCADQKTGQGWRESRLDIRVYLSSTRRIR